MTSKKGYSIAQSDKHTARRWSGAALSEGVAFLVILIPILVGCIMLVGAVGLGTYYKHKLSLAAEAGARYATQSFFWSGMVKPQWADGSGNLDYSKITPKTQQIVNDTLQQMGLPNGPGRSNVTVTPQTLSGVDYCAVTVQVNNLPLLANIGWLPGAINLSDTASLPYSDTSPPATVGFVLSSGSTTSP